MPADQAHYKYAAQPIDERIADLISYVTLDEKIGQLGCLWRTSLVRGGSFDPNFAPYRQREIVATEVTVE